MVRGKGRAILISVFFPLLLSACNFDRDYRMRSWERCRLQGEEYFLKGEFDQAEQAYFKAVKQAEYLGRASYYYGISLMCLGDLYRTMHKYDLAQKQLQKALDVLLKCPSVSDVDKKLLLQNIARTESWLADTYLFDKDYKQAERFYRAAVSTASAWRVKETCAYEDHLLGQTVALSIYKLALIFEKNGRTQESLKCYMEALCVADSSALPIKIKDRIVEDYKTFLVSIGQMEKAKSLEADKNCQEQMDRMESYFRQRKLPQAEAAGKEALLAAEEVDAHDWRIVTILKDLLRIYINTKRYEEAESACRRRLEICQFHKAQQAKISGNVKNNLQSATPLGTLDLPFGGAFDSQTKMMEHNELRIAECKTVLAYIHEQTGKRAQSRLEADEAYKLLMRIGGEKRYEMAAVQQLSDVFLAQGQWKKARLLVKESLLYCSAGSDGINYTYCMCLWRLYCANMACFPGRRFDELLREAQKNTLRLNEDDRQSAGIMLNSMTAVCINNNLLEAAKATARAAMRVGRSIGPEPGSEILQAAHDNYAIILQREGKK